MEVKFLMIFNILLFCKKKSMLYFIKYIVFFFIVGIINIEFYILYVNCKLGLFVMYKWYNFIN